MASSQGLKALGKSPPTELMRSLMLLHSYILVKTLIRMADHQVPHMLQHLLTLLCLSSCHVVSCTGLFSYIVGNTQTCMTNHQSLYMLLARFALLLR